MLRAALAMLVCGWLVDFHMRLKQPSMALTLTINLGSEGVPEAAMSGRSLPLRMKGAQALMEKTSSSSGVDTCPSLKVQLLAGRRSSCCPWASMAFAGKYWAISAFNVGSSSGTSGSRD